MSDAGSAGRSGALLTLYDAISRLKPSFALAVGIAFGNDPAKQRLGEVLVSTIVIRNESARANLEAMSPVLRTRRQDRFF